MELTGKFVVEEVKKKTSAVFFKDLKAGDEFVLSYTLNGRYHDAPTVYISYNGKFVHRNSACQLRNNLSNFVLKQVA